MERLEVTSKNRQDSAQLEFQASLQPVQDKVENIANSLENKLAPVSTAVSTVATAVFGFKDILRQIIQFLGSFQRETKVAFQSVIQTNMQIYALLLNSQNNLNPAPSMSSDSITFEDALGRTISLPHQWFHHWEVGFGKGVL